MLQRFPIECPLSFDARPMRMIALAAASGHLMLTLLLSNTRRTATPAAPRHYMPSLLGTAQCVCVSNMHQAATSVRSPHPMNTAAHQAHS